MRASLTNFIPSRIISLTDILTKPPHLRQGTDCGTRPGLYYSTGNVESFHEVTVTGVWRWPVPSI